MIATLKPRVARQPSMRGEQAIERLVHAGIVIGLPRSVALEQHAVVPLIEIECRREDLPAEQGVRIVTEHTRAQLLWRIDINDLHLADTFSGADWQVFIHLLAASRSAQHMLVLAYDRSVEYSPEVLDSVERLRDATGLSIFLDTEHSSWKTMKVQSILRSLRLPHVSIDGPSLPGIVKDISYTTGNRAVLRCLGRNSRSWFEHGHERYQYVYSAEEITQLAERVLHLREAVDTVYVTMQNRPAAAALTNATELARALLLKQ